MKTTIFLALAIGVILGCSINAAATDNAKREVYAVCNSARLELNGASEEACGQVQDKYNIEFLCEANNNLPATNCWTEAK